MNKSNQVMWFPEGTFKKTEEERERERTLLKKHNPNGEIMYFPEGTFKKEEKKPLTDQQKFIYFIAYPMIFFASPFIAVAAIRDKNIKARIPGVDPLQKNYLKK